MQWPSDGALQPNVEENFQFKKEKTIYSNKTVNNMMMALSHCVLTCNEVYATIVIVWMYIFESTHQILYHDSLQTQKFIFN